MSAQIQQVILGVGGTIETTFVYGRPSAVTVDLYAGKADPSDSSQPLQKLAAASGTVDSVNTTTAEVCEAGDRQVVLASATGVVAGRRYLLGSRDSTEPAEDVTVRAVDGSTAILWAPVAYRHASGVAFVGLRCTCAIPASGTAPNAGADEVWGAGYAVWTPTGSGLEPQTEVVDCVRVKIPETLCGLADLREVHARVLDMLDADTDLMAGLRNARDELLLDLGPARARYTIGTAEFRRAAALKFFLLRRHNLGDQAKAQGFKDEYEQLIQRIRQGQPADRGQNGIPDEVEPLDGSSTDLLGISATATDIFLPANPLAGVFVDAVPDDD